MMRPGLRRFATALGSVLVVLVACGPGSDGSEGTSTGGGSTGSTGEAPTTGTTGGPALVAECEVAADCVLVNNCCECSAKPADAEVAPCEGMCLQSTCDAQLRDGIGVACRMGRCVFAEVECEGAVTCDTLLPDCPKGTTVSVKDECWGPCVESRYCIGRGCPLDGCGDGWTCVEHQASGTQCVPVPLECGGVASCDCAAPYMDEFCPAACVDDGMGKLSCQDGG
ncbi:hypothetical protein [Nannocystis sp.]|uniref:hypothetical protein n=1 Tax=Nannocystis sp. TaxID=1962667 RepID=UPI0024281BB6|nr:hypothetical protein [Nannocystis sp.]MBK7824805.1 hypothetical protein [Nannocystis sp.]MBK9752943.1 hypothetical protein [Nannocystis sp.]